ncbi:pyridoxal-dependent decarboxylase [Corynascus novoguineensis]|uniref:Pyridoxal-dependent decarboxylase n=1 Tax=Corynascus novoguineensis TaxID=1126955 RepID=A0AAN7CX47_9PEZI|nr:pyridoxal-dependent decarboxylase [Corynascus novoguineensis]
MSDINVWYSPVPRIEELNETPSAPQADLSFIVGDSTKVLLQHQRLKSDLAAHSAASAVKCNPHPYLLRFLADLGLGFDCASLAEMELMLGLGVEPSRIVFSRPYKAVSALQTALARGVLLTVFDNAEELDKIQRVDPAMRLLLRIHADDRTALNRLGNKFSVPPHATRPLLLKARVLGLEAVRVSFHICPKVFLTRGVSDRAKNVSQDANFETMAAGIRLATEREFSAAVGGYHRVRIVAKLGGFCARGFYTPVAEAYVPTLIPFDSKDRHGAVTRGRGKHSFACVADRATLPCEVLVGDWFKYSDMGAYTVPCGISFNGFFNTYEVLCVAGPQVIGRKEGVR